MSIIMRDLFCSKLTVLGIVGAIACSHFILPAGARRAYDSSGSGSQSSSSSTPNPYAINQFPPPSVTNTNTNTSTSTSTSTSSTSQSAAPAANQYISPPNHYTPPQNQYSPPKTPYTPPRNHYTPQQNQYTPQNQSTEQQVTHPYLHPQQTRNNGTNFYGLSPEQMSGAAVHEGTYPANGGGGRGGYDPRWNPNFGTGAGAQTMARESGGLAQSLRDNFPLPMGGDEAQMFQVNDFAARSNGGMQRRGP